MRERGDDQGGQEGVADEDFPAEEPPTDDKPPDPIVVGDFVQVRPAADQSPIIGTMARFAGACGNATARVRGGNTDRGHQDGCSSIVVLADLGNIANGAFLVASDAPLGTP